MSTEHLAILNSLIEIDSIVQTSLVIGQQTSCCSTYWNLNFSRLFFLLKSVTGILSN